MPGPLHLSSHVFHLHASRITLQQHLLEILSAPKDSPIFHPELYENLDEHHRLEDDFVLGEITARAPGGSIAHLIDLLTYSKNSGESISCLDIRARVSLPITLPPAQSSTDTSMVMTDLVISRKSDKFMYIPHPCPVLNLTSIPLWLMRPRRRSTRKTTPMP